MNKIIKGIVLTIIYIVLFLFLCDTTISFDPFKITINSLEQGLGILFVVIGSYILSIYYYNKGYNKGCEDCDIPYYED